MSAVSTEMLVRDYLRGCPSVMELLNDQPARLNADWNGDMRATHVTMYRSGGGYHEYMPLQQPVLNIAVFGSTRPAAATLAEEIAERVRDITEAHRPMCCGEVLSINYVPTVDGTARYIVTIYVTTKLGLAA